VRWGDLERRLGELFLGGGISVSRRRSPGQAVCLRGRQLAGEMRRHQERERERETGRVARPPTCLGVRERRDFLVTQLFFSLSLGSRSLASRVYCCYRSTGREGRHDHGYPRAENHLLCLFICFPRWRGGDQIWDRLLGW
jgi:hypothetical protein